jgi:hypothetical protein
MRSPWRLEHIDRIAGYPNPFETYLLVASLVQGVLVALGIGHSTALEAAFSDSPWLRWTWAALGTLGAATALLGLYWRGDPFTGVEVKRVGLIVTGFGALIYAVSLWLSQPVPVAGLPAVAFAVACFVRTWQVSRLLRRAEQAVSAAREGR